MIPLVHAENENQPIRVIFDERQECAHTDRLKINMYHLKYKTSAALLHLCIAIFMLKK